jgi:succinate-semialdehyde dehydrogenase/glutarate-semialdehyde dehydrogenase
VGPLIDAVQRDKVRDLVNDAVEQGARALTGGSVASGNGYFYPPTVLADVPRSARLQKEEIFGPVAPLTAFETEDEAVRMANDTEYGLVSADWARLRSWLGQEGMNSRATPSAR